VTPDGQFSQVGTCVAIVAAHEDLLCRTSARQNCSDETAAAGIRGVEIGRRRSGPFNIHSNVGTGGKPESLSFGRVEMGTHCTCSPWYG
jgi:hypothetical protein